MYNLMRDAMEGKRWDRVEGIVVVVVTILVALALSPKQGVTLNDEIQQRKRNATVLIVRRKLFCEGISIMFCKTGTQSRY